MWADGPRAPTQRRAQRPKGTENFACDVRCRNELLLSTFSPEDQVLHTLTLEDLTRKPLLAPAPAMQAEGSAQTDRESLPPAQPCEEGAQLHAIPFLPAGPVGREAENRQGKRSESKGHRLRPLYLFVSRHRPKLVPSAGFRCLWRGGVEVLPSCQVTPGRRILNRFAWAWRLWARGQGCSASMAPCLVVPLLSTKKTNHC